MKCKLKPILAGAQVTSAVQDKGMGVVEDEYRPQFLVVLWNNGDLLLEMRDQLVLAGYETPVFGDGE